MWPACAWADEIANLAAAERGWIRVEEISLIKDPAPARETVTCLDPAGYFPFPAGEWAVVVLKKKGADWVVQEPPWRVPVSYNILSRQGAAD